MDLIAFGASVRVAHSHCHVGLSRIQRRRLRRTAATSVPTRKLLSFSAQLQSVPAASRSSTSAATRLRISAAATTATIRVPPASPATTILPATTATAAAAKVQHKTFVPRAAPGFLRSRSSRGSSGASGRPSALRTWRPDQLCLPVLQLHWTQESASDWYQLLWSARPAARVHQRCPQHDSLPCRTLRLSERRHGHTHR